MLVNSIGLRPHRALKPFWLVWLVAALWKFVPLVSRLIEHLIFWREWRAIAFCALATHFDPLFLLQFIIKTAFACATQKQPAERCCR